MIQNSDANWTYQSAAAPRGEPGEGTGDDVGDRRADRCMGAETEAGASALGLERSKECSSESSSILAPVLSLCV
jgi:hypothetical protein